MSVRQRLNSGTGRRIVLLAAAALFSSAVGFAASRSDTHSRPDAALTSIALPEGWTVTGIAVVGGRPALFGTWPGSRQSATMLNGGRCRLFLVADAPLRVTTSKAVSCDVGADLIRNEYLDGPYLMGIRITQFGTDGGAATGGYSATVIDESGSALLALERPDGSTGSATACGPASVKRIDLASGSVRVVARLPAGQASAVGGCADPIGPQGVELAGRLYLLDGYDPSSGGFGELYSIAEG